MGNKKRNKSKNKLNMGTPTNLMKEAAEMAWRVPVFLSHPAFTTPLNERQIEFLHELIKQIKKALLFPRTLPDTEQYPEKTLTNIRRIILSSYGLVAANLRTIQTQAIANNLGPLEHKGEPTWEGSPFLQIEPAMAFQHGLPLLLIREKGVQQLGIWDERRQPFFVIEWNSKPKNSVKTFFESVEWKELFQNWVAEVRNGYFIQTEPEFQYRCDKRSE